MTQDLYQNAIKFAGEKHKSQKVPGTNSNYLLHLSNVAMEVLMAYLSEKNFDINFAIQLALLRDVIEDTDATAIELEKIFDHSISEGVVALSKDESISNKKERMIDSLNRINDLEKEVGIVKLADRITNLQVPPKFWSKEKITSYLEEAKLLSLRLSNKNQYLNTRLEEKISEYEKHT